MKNDKAFMECPIALAQNLIGGKWKIAILWLLGQKTSRFNELKKQLTGITQKMLTQQLRELEESKLVHRKVYPVVPPKVEYSLTDIGRELFPVFEQMWIWGKHYKEAAGLENIEFQCKMQF